MSGRLTFEARFFNSKNSTKRAKNLILKTRHDLFWKQINHLNPWRNQKS